MMVREGLRVNVALWIRDSGQLQRGLVPGWPETVTLVFHLESVSVGFERLRKFVANILHDQAAQRIALNVTRRFVFGKFPH